MNYFLDYFWKLKRLFGLGSEIINYGISFFNHYLPEIVIKKHHLLILEDVIFFFEEIRKNEKKKKSYKDIN